jgi:hypothetical protein
MTWHREYRKAQKRCQAHAMRHGSAKTNAMRTAGGEGVHAFGWAQIYEWTQIYKWTGAIFVTLVSIREFELPSDHSWIGAPLFRFLSAAS